MDQHPHPLAYHLPPEPPRNNNNNLQDRHEVDDKKNGVVLAPTATPYSLDRHQLLTCASETLKPISPPSSGVRYKECLKNHAASMGANVVDGCGEFMPSGKEGTFEALKCAACQCHRNFHRRDHDSSPNFSRSVILHLPPTTQHPSFNHHQILQPMTIPYGATDSSSDDLVQVFDEMPQRELLMEAAGSNRKRFRTRFTQEQKEKMLEFAEKLGWRLQRQDDEMVERFCNEVGVRRQVLKVWMHNNKNSFKKPNFIPDHEHPSPLQPQNLQIHQHQETTSL